MTVENLSTIKASIDCIEDFITVCDECASEMESRNPRIITHTKNYMANYSTSLKSRLILELQAALGVSNKRIMEVGESSLFAGIGFLSLIEDLGCYRFLPKDFLSGIKSNLVNIGTLISSVLDIAIERIEG